MNTSKLVMVGCLYTGLLSIKKLLENGIKIDYFVTIDENIAAKNKVSGYACFKELANSYNIPIYICKSYNLTHPEDISFFESQKFDLLLQGGWQRLFPDSILNTLSIGAIGIHGSSALLPKGRGRSPINWSLIEGKTRFIIHYFLIKPGIDDGDIFHYDSFDINEWDDCKTLYYKNSIVTAKVMLEWIPRLLSKNFILIPQKGEPSYYPKRTREDGIIVWSNSMMEIYNFIRALTNPYPGAYSYYNDQEIIIWRAQPFDTRIIYRDKVEGEIVEVFDDGNFVVYCNDGLLLVTEYKSLLEVQIGVILLQSKRH